MNICGSCAITKTFVTGKLGELFFWHVDNPSNHNSHLKNSMVSCKNNPKVETVPKCKKHTFFWNCVYGHVFFIKTLSTEKSIIVHNSYGHNSP